MIEDLPIGPWGQFLLLALAVLVASQAAQRLLRPLVLRLAAFSPIVVGMVRRGDRPLQLLVPLAAMQLALQAMPDGVRGLAFVERWNGVLTILAITWLAIGVVRGIADGVISLHPADVADNLNARRIHTQTRVLSRVVAGTVVVAGLAFVLMMFPRARQLGASLLASAGVAGLVIGIAARSVVGNLLAGLQIALAQPLRIDDVLIVEGEWGRVEEITATYVVLKIWDERRLIVPLSWFIEKPFQNWTRINADILGTVMLWFDHTLPVERLRQETARLCAASPYWDGRVCVVQVTDANERAIQVRVLVSSRDSGANFDLRCALREALIDYVRGAFPHALPRVRADLSETPQPDAPAPAPAPGPASVAAAPASPSPSPGDDPPHGPPPRA